MDGRAAAVVNAPGMQESPQQVDVPFARLAQGIQALSERGMTYCFIGTAPTTSEQSVTGGCTAP